MCRFLVYKGRDRRFRVRLSDLIVKPVHSIIHQSFDCRERITEGTVPPALNGDGFGIGWYADGEAKGEGKDKDGVLSEGAAPEIKPAPGGCGAVGLRVSDGRWGFRAAACCLPGHRFVNMHSLCGQSQLHSGMRQ
ncbi:MAG: hypothetical protein P4L40_17510 [Terracidiphilus sp.]|nr:hypothetical protein [Terracidiphilus sp.]